MANESDGRLCGLGALLGRRCVGNDRLLAAEDEAVDLPRYSNTAANTIQYALPRCMLYG